MLASEGVPHPEGIHGGTAQKFGKDRKKSRLIQQRLSFSARSLWMRNERSFGTGHVNRGIPREAR